MNQKTTVSFFVLSLTAVLFTACNWLNPPQTAAPDDTEAPSIVLKAEVTSDQRLVLRAETRDNKRVYKVQFYQQTPEGLSLVSEDTSAPFDLQINPQEVAQNLPLFTALAFDEAGNSNIAPLLDFQETSLKSLLSRDLKLSVADTNAFPFITNKETLYSYNTNLNRKTIMGQLKGFTLPIVLLPIEVKPSSDKKLVSIEGYAVNLSRESQKPTWLTFNSFNPTSTTLTNPSGYTSSKEAFLEMPGMSKLEVRKIKWGFNNPSAKNFSFDVKVTHAQTVPLELQTAAPNVTRNDLDALVTLTGKGFRAETEFFVESKKLEVRLWNPTSATVVVPSGFLPGTYGVMAVNPGGENAVLYPAFEVTSGPTPPSADPKDHPFSFVDGFVTDYPNQQAIYGAKVTVKFQVSGKTKQLQTTTGTDGYYLLRGVPPGKHLVEIHAEGYEPVYRISNVTDSGIDPSKGATVTLKLAELEPIAPQVTEIGPEGGIHYASDNGKDGPFLVVPPGALSQNVPIRFTHTRAANTLPELPDDGYYLAFAHLEPVGLTFKKPATLYLPLQPGIKLSLGQKINISYYDPKDGKWVQDITSGKITELNGKQFLEYEINHFTWIGGEWFPDPVKGSVIYANGRPAAGVTTNWGVTNGSGQYFGTTTQSQIERTVKAYAVGKDGQHQGQVEAYYTGTGPLNFPVMVLPTPETPEFTDPKISQPCEAGGVPFIVSSNQPKIQSSSIASTQQMVVLSEALTGLSTALMGNSAQNIIPNSIRITLNGKDITNQFTLGFNAFNELELKSNFKEPLKSGLHQNLLFTANSRNGEQVNKSIDLSVIGRIRSISTYVHTVPDGTIDYSSIESSYIINFDEDGTKYIFIEESKIGLLKQGLSVPIELLDESGKIMDYSGPMFFKYDTSDWNDSYVMSYSDFINGKSLAIISFDNSQLLNFKKIIFSKFEANSFSKFSIPCTTFVNGFPGDDNMKGKIGANVFPRVRKWAKGRLTKGPPTTSPTVTGPRDFFGILDPNGSFSDIPQRTVSGTNEPFISANKLIQLIPSNVRDIFVSNKQYKEGFKYRWTDSVGNDIEVWAHSPQNPPVAGQLSSREWTVRIKVETPNGSQRYLSKEGTYINDSALNFEERTHILLGW